MARYADAMHDFDIKLDQLHRERRSVLADLEKEKTTLETMLAIEEQRAASVGGQVKASPLPPLMTLRDFLVATVKQSDEPLDKDWLQAEARAAGFEENGRAFNMTLQNIATGDKIRKLPDGRFCRSETTDDNLFGTGLRATKEMPMTAQ